jgi:hypothetical protein
MINEHQQKIHLCSGQPLRRVRVEQGVARDGVGGDRLRVPRSSKRLRRSHAARAKSGHCKVQDFKAI